MSKKSKRQSSRAAFAADASRRTEFNPDYSLIKRDLKRIGILAGAFIAVLIVLGLFQNQILGLFLK
jgi:hypothetical protein